MTHMNHKEYDKKELDKKRIELEVEQMKKTQTQHIKDKFGGSTNDKLEEE